MKIISRLKLILPDTYQHLNLSRGRIPHFISYVLFSFILNQLSCTYQLVWTDQFPEKATLIQLDS